jgi:ATP-dependent helicase/nuclease subunit A
MDPHPIVPTHPIVAQMRPSDEQRPAVLVGDRDVVVTAGAGTGKTRTLVARYLSLLAEGLPARSILAITFTRKAAREMRNRVRDEIRRYLDRADLDGEVWARWQQHYSALDAARISTIHRLCSEILRAHPAEANVDPRFEVLDDGQATILRNRALDEAMAWAADDPEVVRLFALLGESGLGDTLGALVGQRLEAGSWFESLAGPLWPLWEAQLLPFIQAFVDDARVRALFADLLLLRDDGTLDRAEAAGDRLADPLRQLLALWDEISTARQEGDWGAVSVRLAPLRATMKQVGRAANWRPADPKAAIRDLQAAYDTHTAAWQRKAINLTLDRQLAETMPLLRALFQQACTTYTRLKAERQALDYDDLEEGALGLLRQDRVVRARWQQEFRAILVDEFQDTNGRQRDLVALLNDGSGKLFIVGDAKQSIYRFRGANVAVFRRERERIEEEGGKHIPLETSYRAHRALIRGLNDLLRPVLAKEADPARPWVEPFAPLGHYREDPGPGFVAPHIELHVAVGSKADGALDRAADALAGRIVALVEGGAQVVAGDRTRPLDYGDVAILCRGSRSFSAYEDALERAGVPFLTVAGRGFYGRPEIRDLLNALQALADPTDDLALAGLLRSPVFALSDMALYDLCQARGQVGESCSLWEVLRSAPGTSAEDDGARARRAAQLVAGLHEQVGRSSVADVLKAFLDATDYRAALIQAGQPRAARNVAKLLADAHSSGIVGVGEFLEYVTGLRDSGTREGEARATAEGAVQIMTVHAAKGLEFPVVAIGDVTHTGGGGSGLLIDPDLGALPYVKDEEGRLPAVYHLGKSRSDDQEEAESDRLLYVAATRAREKLILSGCIRLKKDGTVSKPGGWLGKLGGPECLGLTGCEVAYDESGTGGLQTTLRMDTSPVSCTVYEPGYVWDMRPHEAAGSAEPVGTMPPPLLDPVAPGREHVDPKLLEQDRIPPQRVWRVVPPVKRPRAPAWVIGSLVHEALAAWRFPNGAAPVGAVHGFEHWAEARAREYGITDAQQLADAVRRSRQLLLRFESHSLYGEMDGADLRLHEVPYSLVVDGRVESGIIDALYQREGTWTLVEFKTDRVNNRSELERLLAEEGYFAQAQRYIAAAERLLGQQPQFILCMLHYGGTVYLHRLGIGSDG